MKILHITPSLAGGGAERMLSKIAEYDDTNEHIIISLLNMKSHYQIEKSKVISLDLKNNSLNKLKAIYILYNKIREIDPDIIQTWMKSNFYGPLLKIVTRKKIISNFRNGYIGTQNKLILSIYNSYLKIFNGHIFVSQSALKEREKAGLKFSNYKVITNGFEIPEQKAKNIEEKLIIGHLGRYHEIKNQKMIIDAFEVFCRDKNTTLLLAGKELNRNNLNVSSIPNDKIKFLGEISDTSKFYESIDIFVLTSKSEGFPNVIGEAMSYGKPVITTNSGESFQIIGDTGYKIKSTNELIKIFDKLYNNKQEIKENGIRAKERIRENYEINKIIQEYITFYE